MAGLAPGRPGRVQPFRHAGRAVDGVPGFRARPALSHHQGLYRVDSVSDDDDADPIFQPNPFLQEGLAVRIMDLSGANGAEPVEVVTGFRTVEHANTFARRYVRDSLERCRVSGMSADEVMASWFAFGEDAEVQGAAEHAWTSAAELADFAALPVRDAEDRNWRALDPRRDEDDVAGEEE